MRKLNCHPYTRKRQPGFVAANLKVDKKIDMQMELPYISMIEKMFNEEK
jgi:hypothetical protein